MKKSTLATFMLILLISSSVWGEKARPIRWEYWALVSTQAVVGIADAEISKKLEAKAPISYELNPFLGRHSSRARMYLEGTAMLAVVNTSAVTANSTIFIQEDSSF